MDLMGSHVLRGKPRANFPLHEPLPYPGLREFGLTKSPPATKRFEAVSVERPKSLPLPLVQSWERYDRRASGR
jgi:hypothetical protein